ncbi:MAG TPA: MmgE/PrpD family protein [Thermodesulfobacteriota bacterium]
MGSDATVAEQLGHFLSTLTFERLPQEVVEKSKICLLDAIGTALEGYRFEPISLAYDVAETTSERGDVTLWGRGRTAGVLPAAFANCVAIHALLHDDTLMNSWSHPAGPVVAAAVAVAEWRGASGARTLLGIVAGYEVMGRLGGAGVVAFDGIRRGFRANSTYGVFGAAAAAATIIGLNEEAYANALACAASFANGIIEPLHAGSMEWRHETGVAAQNGVLAALLAQRGLRAARTAFEGRFGFWRAFGDAAEPPASATAGLGRSFQITQAFHKPYPTASEYTWNSAMYVTHQLALENGIDYREVDRCEITVMTKMLTYPGLAYAGPYVNIDQAIASKPFAIAAILKNHGFTSDVYRTQLQSPELLELARRVRVRGCDAWNDEWRCHVSVVMKDGRVFSGDERMVERSIFYPNRQQITRKFRTMLAETPFGPCCDEIAAQVFALDTAPSVKPMTSSLARPAR